MQQPTIRPLFEHLSRSLLLASAGAVLLTGIGLCLFALRNIGLTRDTTHQLQTLQHVLATAQTQTRAETIAALQRMFTRPLRDPFQARLIDAEGAVHFDSLTEQRRLIHNLQQMTQDHQAHPMVYSVPGHHSLQLELMANPLSEVREVTENLSVALLALLALTVFVYYSSRRRMRQAFAPLSDITRRLQTLESGGSDAEPLPSADTQELNRMAQSVNHLQMEWARLQSRQLEWMNRLQDLQESERRQIAAELHDELGQQLTALQVDAATLKRICATQPDAFAIAEAVLQNSQTLMHRVRGLLQQLRPSGLDGADDQTAALADSLERLMNEWRTRLPDTHLRLSLQLPNHNLPSRLSLAAYRLIQEGLTNAARHANAHSISVEVSHAVCTLQERTGDWLMIRIADDGQGMETTAHTAPANATTVQSLSNARLDDTVSAQTPSAEGDGLPRSLRERTKANGGVLTVQTAPGEGYRLDIALPLYAEK